MPFHLSWRISLTSTPQVFSQSSPRGSIKVNIWEIHKPWKTALNNPWEGFGSCMILDILVMTSCSNMFHDFFRWKILLWITRPHHPQCHLNLVQQFKNGLKLIKQETQNGCTLPDIHKRSSKTLHGSTSIRSIRSFSRLKKTLRYWIK